MDRISRVLFAAIMAACIIASLACTAGHADDEASPIYGVTIPPGVP